MKRLIIVLVSAALLLTVGGIGLGQVLHSSSDPSDSAGVAPSSTNQLDTPTTSDADTLSMSIASLQALLKVSPNDAESWASLALAYVQEAKVTVDPSYYPKAQQCLDKSLMLQASGNFSADAGESALSSARHDFVAARSWAQQGLKVDSYNATLWGALADSQTQLGNYTQATAAVQKMLNLRPDTASYSRASYVYELEGKIPQAEQAMQQAYNYASNGADQAFANYYLAELNLDHGNPGEALKEINLGLVADPSYAALIEGRAKAEEALGQTAAALKDFATIVGEVPQPEYVIEYGELLQSLGQTAQAKTQYDLFLTEEKLFEANGVALDTDPTLFQADHGTPAAALKYGEYAIKIRPFLESYDAYAWALHVSGRDADALVAEQKATSQGMKNALFYFHLGIIQKSLGNRSAAIAALRNALTINPHFSPLHVPDAKKALQQLGAA